MCGFSRSALWASGNGARQADAAAREKTLADQKAPAVAIATRSVAGHFLDPPTTARDWRAHVAMCDLVQCGLLVDRVYSTPRKACYRHIPILGLGHQTVSVRHGGITR